MMRFPITLLFALVVAGCHAGPTDQAMSTLTAQLQDAFPDQIVDISFENSPPIDPPTIFIDLASSMSSNEELRFLCVSVKPRVDAVDTAIEVTTSYGWYLRAECARPGVTFGVVD